MKKTDFIEIRGAHAHNLKGVNIDIPRGKFVAITGLSGSGKSSLAFDTIYAEGQRRYLNTLSPYAKHFIGILEKPQVESIEGLSPIIAIEQKTTGNNPRSTVGTITEISDFLRLLFAKASKAYSPISGKEMVRYTDKQIEDLIMNNYSGSKCLLLSPLIHGRKGHYRDLFEQMRKRGYTEAVIDGDRVNLTEIEALDRYKAHNIELVVDKLKPESGDEKRIRASVQTALSIGKGSIAVMDAQSGSITYYSKHFVDPDTGLSIKEPAPHSFSFNSPEGCCPHCKGLGMIVDINLESIIPNPNLSINEGGIVPLGSAKENRKFDIVRAIARKHGFSLYEPIADIPQECVNLLIFGSDELFRVGEGSSSEMVVWEGIVDDIEDKIVCPSCHGTRLNDNALCFKITGKNIADVCSMEISELRKWLGGLDEHFTLRQKVIARDVLKELVERVDFLLDVGLDYLTLDRATATLSGGESQRIRLATQIGSKLVNVIYILDEPSIGLHQRDNLKLISSLRKLKDEGNTVIVVEHDMETMLAADWLVDVGPGAGENGGFICYNGPREGARKSSVTLDYLLHKKEIAVPQTRRKGSGKMLSIHGARGNNLKNIDVDFPLGCLIGISGVSGSGKSTLINETLVPAVKSNLYQTREKPLEFDNISGLENIDKVIRIDQSPIGKSPRSNPATYTGVFDDIRKLFEETPDAKIRGFRAGRFSFNVSGGRCEECKGAGIKVIEMNFLPSVNAVCDCCRGRRYKDDTLEVKYKGKNINDILEMPISEAYEFFKSNPRIAPKLKALVDVGLGYVHLGQSAVTLSGGESQRMKLATELAKKGTGSTLYMLDEPTTGLHFEDIRILLNVLHSLVEQGNTVIVIEHNPDVLKNVDYLIDMGPDGGRRGGRVISCGTPEEVAADQNSPTGKFLKTII